MVRNIFICYHKNSHTFTLLRATYHIFLDNQANIMKSEVHFRTVQLVKHNEFIKSAELHIKHKLTLFSLAEDSKNAAFHESASDFPVL